MKHQNYLNAKQIIVEVAKEQKRRFKTDKPLIRQTINDTADYLIKELNNKESEKKAKMYQSWLSNLAANLHP